MTMTHDKIAGLCTILLGAILLFWLTPAATETVDYGWMRPNTLPNILAWMMIIAGVGLALLPSEPSAPSFMLIGKGASYFLVIVMGLFAMSHFGYLVVAPLLALAVMLLLGERRLFWLLTGSALVPTAIWLFVEVLLSRPLP